MPMNVFLNEYDKTPKTARIEVLFGRKERVATCPPVNLYNSHLVDRIAHLQSSE
jgi:hypothetical protein